MVISKTETQQQDKKVSKRLQKWGYVSGWDIFMGTGGGLDGIKCGLDRKERAVVLKFWELYVSSVSHFGTHFTLCLMAAHTTTVSAFASFSRLKLL